MSTEEVKHETAAAVAAEEAEDHEDGGVETGEGEEPQAYFEPVVKLNEVEVVSGEEDEEVLFSMRAKLFDYRETLLDKGTGNKSWCERGIGNVRFLKHKEAGKVRMLMRQEKTLKITINHLVESRSELGANMGSDRAWVWTCYDFSEGIVEPKTFALRFANAENAQAFKEAHENAKKINKALEAGADAADTSAGDEAAKALEGLEVKKD
ncbi:ran-specific GTPase-activating protein [Achlya hypogyna]|uniref:Ran-specific GTPase-activating protein n=1 Tax=Achlya hypogyna TaxID=1202772 RepID=A0A1V9ZAI7_ACHHY|nr:ran-specific GTPase-activating protein [Achlya hypogyna]